MTNIGKKNRVTILGYGEEKLDKVEFNTFKETIDEKIAEATDSNEVIGAINSKVADLETLKIDKATFDTFSSTVDKKVETVTTQLAETVKKSEVISLVTTKAEKSEVQALDIKIKSQASGSPKGTYTTLTALQTAFPTGNENIYLVTKDGKWYYWDGSTWAPGGQYQSTGIEDLGITTEKLAKKAVTYSETNFVTVGKNLLDKRKALKDYTLLKSGVISSYINAYVSDFIPVIPNTNYILSVDRVTCFYTSNKEFIEGINTQGTFLTPSNCFYIRVALHKDNIETFQVEIGKVSTPYEAFKLKMIDIEPDISLLKEKTLNGNAMIDKTLPIEALEVELIEKGKNLFNKSQVELDKSLAPTTGVSYDSVGSAISEYVAIEGNTEYILSHKDRRIGFYDSNKKFISLVTASDSFITPVNAKYLRVSVVTRLLDSVQLEKGNKRTSFEPFAYALSGKNNWILKKENSFIEHKDNSIPFGSFDNGVKRKFTMFKERDKANIQLYGHVLCDIPTYDDRLTITHPSVVYKESGWNGYKYWMAMTPYPDAIRENPSIVASNDGIDWEVPKGLVNPVFAQQQAVSLGYTTNSDTHLIFSPDGTKLLMYFRSMYGKGEGIILVTSTDGINWTSPVDTLSVPYVLGSDGVTKNFVSILSPAILIDDDRSFVMWTANNNGTDRTKMIEKRTSSDGLSWTNPVACNVPLIASFVPYHPEVKKYNGVYHMLLASNVGLRIRHLTSTDGSTWVDNAKLGDLPKSGFEWDKDGYYRSSLLPKENGKFDMWISGIRIVGSGGAWGNESEWRISYYPDVDLTNGIFPQIRKNKTQYGMVSNSPITTTGYINGDRYEYTDPTDFIGKVVVNGVWKNFGAIS